VYIRGHEREERESVRERGRDRVRESERHVYGRQCA